MWQEISGKIKKKLGEEEYDHCKSVVQLGYADNVLRLQCPNDYYGRIVNDLISRAGYSSIKVEWSYSPDIPLTSVSAEATGVCPNSAETKSVDKKRKRTSFERNPKFKSEAELNTYIGKTKIDVQQLSSISADYADSQQTGIASYKPQITDMPNKYGITGIANWITLNSAMWAYPNDKRKSATVPIHIDCADGSKVYYTLHRGKVTPKDDGYGQLTTMHCRVMMVIISLWQKQRCKLFSNCAIVRCTVADIIHLLGIKYNGAAYKRVLQYITDLAALPFCMVNDSSSIGYTLLSAVNLSIGGEYRLLLHPFISRQLVGRKAIMRDNNICKISNPIALKLLLLLDSRLAVGHKVVVSLADLAKELGLSSDMYNNFRYIKRAIVTFKEVSVCGKTIDMQLSKNGDGKWQLVASLKPFALVKNDIKGLAGCKL